MGGDADRNGDDEDALPLAEEVGEACSSPEMADASLCPDGPKEVVSPVEGDGGGGSPVEVRMHLHREKSPEAFAKEELQSVG